MRILLIAFTVLVSAQQLHAQLRAQLEKEIGKILRYDINIDYNKVPGFVIGVIMGDSTYVFGYGLAEKDSHRVPDGNTIFEIGDVTKVFTASLISQLAGSGQLDYSTTLDSYLPKHDKNLYSHTVTLLDLVTHTSGLPKMPFEFGLREKEDNNPYAYYTKNDLISFYREYVFDEEEERKYLFSNVNYALLGELLEYQTGKSYESILKERILNPIGMNDTQIVLSEEQESRLAKGYSISGQEMPPWKYQSFEASVGLKSTANDLIKFIRVQMGQEHEQLFKTFYTTQTSVYKTEIDKRTYIGKGWHVLKNKRYYDLIAHSGTTSGHRAFIGFVRESQTAVIVLSNSKLGMNGLGYLVLKMLNHHWRKRKQ